MTELILRKFPTAETVGDIGRGAQIRTGDPLLPKQVRYQTALRPDVITLTLSTPYFNYNPNLTLVKPGDITVMNLTSGIR